MSVALVIQQEKRKQRIILSPVACPAVPYFYTLSYKRHDFRKNITEYKMCILIFSTSASEDFSFYEEFSKILSSMYKRFHVKHPLFVSDFNKTWIFLTGFRKNTQNKIS